MVMDGGKNRKNLEEMLKKEFLAEELRLVGRDEYTGRSDSSVAEAPVRNDKT